MVLRSGGLTDTNKDMPDLTAPKIRESALLFDEESFNSFSGWQAFSSGRSQTTDRRLRTSKFENFNVSDEGMRLAQMSS